MYCPFPVPGSLRGWCFSVCLCSALLCFFLFSCATNVHLIPASGDDEVYHMTVSRAGMRPGRLVCILLFEHDVGQYQIELSANRSSPLELHFPIPYLPKAEGYLSFSLLILALKSPIRRSLSVLGMFLSVPFSLL